MSARVAADAARPPGLAPPLPVGSLRARRRPGAPTGGRRPGRLDEREPLLAALAATTVPAVAEADPAQMSQALAAPARRRSARMVAHAARRTRGRAAPRRRRAAGRAAAILRRCWSRRPPRPGRCRLRSARSGRLLPLLRRRGRAQRARRRRCPARPARATSCICTAAACSSASARGISRWRSSPARWSAALAAGNAVVGQAGGADAGGRAARWSSCCTPPACRPTRCAAARPGRDGRRRAGRRRRASAGVCFTGSTPVAQIDQPRARGANDGAIVPLIAETGGINAMIVDSQRAARAGGRCGRAERLPLGRPALLGAAPAVRARRHRRRRDRDGARRAARTERRRPGAARDRRRPGDRRARHSTASRRHVERLRARGASIGEAPLHAPTPASRASSRPSPSSCRRSPDVTQRDLRPGAARRALARRRRRGGRADQRARLRPDARHPDPHRQPRPAPRARQRASATSTSTAT